MPGNVDAQAQAQSLLQEVLRLLDEAGLHHSAIYAQMALDCLSEDDAEETS